MPGTTIASGNKAKPNTRRGGRRGRRRNKRSVDKENSHIPTKKSNHVANSKNNKPVNSIATATTTKTKTTTKTAASVTVIQPQPLKSNTNNNNNNRKVTGGKSRRGRKSRASKSKNKTKNVVAQQHAHTEPATTATAHAMAVGPTTPSRIPRPRSKKVYALEQTADVTPQQLRKMLIDKENEVSNLRNIMETFQQEISHLKSLAVTKSPGKVASRTNLDDVLNQSYRSPSPKRTQPRTKATPEPAIQKRVPLPRQSPVQSPAPSLQAYAENPATSNACAIHVQQKKQESRAKQLDMAMNELRKKVKSLRSKFEVQENKYAATESQYAKTPPQVNKLSASRIRAIATCPRYSSSSSSGMPIPFTERREHSRDTNGNNVDADMMNHPTMSRPKPTRRTPKSQGKRRRGRFSSGFTNTMEDASQRQSIESAQARIVLTDEPTADRQQDIRQVAALMECISTDVSTVTSADDTTEYEPEVMAKLGEQYPELLAPDEDTMDEESIVTSVTGDDQHEAVDCPTACLDLAEIMRMTEITPSDCEEEQEQEQEQEREDYDDEEEQEEEDEAGEEYEQQAYNVDNHPYNAASANGLDFDDYAYEVAADEKYGQDTHEDVVQDDFAHDLQQSRHVITQFLQNEDLTEMDATMLVNLHDTAAQLEELHLVQQMQSAEQEDAARRSQAAGMTQHVKTKVTKFVSRRFNQLKSVFTHVVKAVTHIRRHSRSLSFMTTVPEESTGSVEEESNSSIHSEYQPPAFMSEDDRAKQIKELAAMSHAVALCNESLQSLGDLHEAWQADNNTADDLTLMLDDTTTPVSGHGTPRRENERKAELHMLADMLENMTNGEVNMAANQCTSMTPTKPVNDVDELARMMSQLAPAGDEVDSKNTSAEVTVDAEQTEEEEQARVDQAAAEVEQVPSTVKQLASFFDKVVGRNESEDDQKSMFDNKCSEEESYADAECDNSTSSQEDELPTFEDFGFKDSDFGPPVRQSISDVLINNGSSSHNGSVLKANSLLHPLKNRKRWSKYAHAPLGNPATAWMYAPAVESSDSESENDNAVSATSTPFAIFGAVRRHLF
jgi:hypothetical protein